jgi:hypothetical protein
MELRGAGVADNPGSSMITDGNGIAQSNCGSSLRVRLSSKKCG